MNVLELALLKGYSIDKNGILRNFKNEIVKGCIKKTKGYKLKITGIRYKGKRYNLTFHRFQAYIKYGNDMFKSGIEVRHLNGDSLDNSYDNIAIGTHSQNMMDIPIEERKRKASLGNLKHKHLDIVNDHKNGMSYSKLMKKYNISSKGTISHIINKSYSVSLLC